MHAMLKKIVSEKRQEVKRLKSRGLIADVNSVVPVIRDFKKAVSLPQRVGVIAEIKFASPSAGMIRDEGDPVGIGEIYERAGAAAISLLTDASFFKGNLRWLPPLKNAVSLPILRKDFILDEIQVKESFLHGADAVLLIASILTRTQLESLLGLTRELGMAALTEVHTAEEMETAVACGADIIGINNRDLNTFKVDLQTTLDLASMAESGSILVSESGIHEKEDIKKLGACGVSAVLVGTAIMKSRRMEKTLEGLVAAGDVGHDQG